MPEEKAGTTGHSDSDDPEAEEKKEKAPAWRMLVGTAMQDNFNVPMMYTDVAREGCLGELKRNPLLQVTAAGNMTRGEAIEAAKKDDKLYVLWMELVVDNFTASTRDGFDLRYMLYEPKTARVIGSGSGYPVQSTNMPLPTIGMNSAQYRVHLAGRDVARQVMSRLNMQPKGRFPYGESSDLRPWTSEDVWEPGVHNPRTRQAKASELMRAPAPQADFRTGYQTSVFGRDNLCRDIMPYHRCPGMKV